MEYVLYAIVGLGVLCVTVKLVVYGIYQGMIRAAKQMAKSDHPLMKMLVKKFETCYQLKMGVENVEVFVDK